MARKQHRVGGAIGALILLGSVSLVSWGAAPPASAATTITVTTHADELNVDGDCSLREAVQAVNTGAAVDACPAGSNHIVLPTGPSPSRRHSWCGCRRSSPAAAG